MNGWALLFGYGLGSIPFAFLVARAAGGVDVRAAGSGNVGAANVLRTTRPWAGLLAAALDVAKGSAAVWLAGALGGSDAGRAAAGVAAVIGHIYPVWLRFQGGKGVAVACGVFGPLAPLATLMAVALFGLAVAVTRYISVGSLVAVLTLPALLGATGGTRAVVYAGMTIATLILFRHRANLRRLMARTEWRLGGHP
jgi:acyl phosphate:glycerol-3-phosphate acyltransferase